MDSGSKTVHPIGTGALLYTIGEAADVLGISIPTIRMYEREGLLIPHRRHSRHRRFTESDIERIKCIRKMVNEEKVSLAGIRHLLSLIPCWTIKGCPTDVRDDCAAFRQHDFPCWMVSGKSWDCRSSECRECPIYTEVASCETLKRTIAACIDQSSGDRKLVVPTKEEHVNG